MFGSGGGKEKQLITGGLLGQNKMFHLQLLLRTKSFYCVNLTWRCFYKLNIGEFIVISEQIQH